MSAPSDPRPTPGLLRPQLGVFGAVMMGLGSIIGTGVFVSIGIAAGIAGSMVIVAIVLAAVLAVCNALSSAQLAAAHPYSGGTYEYGRRYLTPSAGFTAGWMFLCAKTASAATAALGFSGYLLLLTGWEWEHNRVLVALGTIAALTILVASGIRRSNTVNIVIVSITLAALIALVMAGASSVDPARLRLFGADSAWEARSGMGALLHAAALMFVAYTGYGRIATLNEEVHAPRRTIPAAIIVTLVVSAAMYLAVAVVSVGTIGSGALADAAATSAAPLVEVAHALDRPFVAWAVSIGAMTAMLGVLLNLILGLSRVLMAMGRRGDMPGAVARLNASRTTPLVAVVAVGAAIAGITLIGDVRVTWSFSAFTVLVYYAITNLAALRLQPPERLYHPALAWCGFGGCVFLAFWVEAGVWLTGLALIALGLVWRRAYRRVVRGSA